MFCVAVVKGLSVLQYRVLYTFRFFEINEPISNNLQIEYRSSRWEKSQITLLVINRLKTELLSRTHSFQNVCLFVCVEVLRPSQANGVMSIAVSLPNHTCTGQA